MLKYTKNPFENGFCLVFLNLLLPLLQEAQVEPKPNPSQTQVKPKLNPSQTQVKPKSNPSRTLTATPST